jgi:tartrate-resistant acid phosphatase type 5
MDGRQGAGKESLMRRAHRALAILDRASILYLAGHDHDMQHLKPEGRLHFFVAGSAGKLRLIEPGPRSLFARSANGFAVLEADARALTVKFVQEDLTSPYTYTLTRP